MKVLKKVLIIVCFAAERVVECAGDASVFDLSKNLRGMQMNKRLIDNDNGQILACEHVVILDPFAANTEDDEGFPLQDGSIYFPIDGRVPLFADVEIWSCANISSIDPKNDPITNWYMMMFGVIPFQGDGTCPEDYVKAGWTKDVQKCPIITFDEAPISIFYRTLSFQSDFRQVASSKKGRKILYRTLLKMKSTNPNANELRMLIYFDHSKETTWLGGEQISFDYACEKPLDLQKALKQYYNHLCGVSRINSMSNLSLLSTNEGPQLSLDIKQYIHIVNDFFKKNGQDPQFGDAMQEYYDRTVITLRRLGEIFKFKTYPTSHLSRNIPPKAASLEVISIDISWPNLRRIVLDFFYKTASEPITPTELSKNQPITLMHLKWVFDEFEDLFDKVENPLPTDDLNKSGVTEAQTELILKLCTGGPERLFNISKFGDQRFFTGATQDDLRIFQNALRKMFASQSGFQRIVSLLYDQPLALAHLKWVFSEFKDLFDKIESPLPTDDLNKTGLTDAQIELVLILSDRESERIFSTSSLSNFRPVTGNLHYDFEYFRHTFMNMLANRSSFSRIMPFLKDQTIILSYLKSIFDDFKSLLNRIENASPISILNQTEVVANQAEIFFRLCTGRGERLFNISKLGNPRLFLYANIDDLEIFQNALRQMLGNRSGFQRIMSLLAVNTINQDARTPFTKGFKSVSIEISARCPYNVAETNSICNYFDGTININIRKLDEYRELANGFMVSLFRAMSHVYHDMLGVNMQNLNRWLSNASIMNSSPFNFIYEFFPMLTHARMDPILKKIVDNITDPTDLSSEGHEFILNIITFAMSQGFGNVLLSDISTKDLRSNAWITKEIMAKCMYLYSFVMTADKTVSSDGLWTSSEEKITMRGNDIFLINQQIFMIEDRQNKSIYTVREKRRDAEFIKTREFHQFHSSLQVSSCALFTEACNTLGIANPLSNQDIARIFVPLGNKYTTTENPFYKISEPTILSQPSLNYFCGLRHACSFDTSKELEEGLDAKQVDLTTINTCRGVCTPLVIAISGGQTNLFKKLLNKGADPLIGGSFSALSVCISEINVDAVEYILNHIKGPISSEDAYYVIRALIAIFSTHDPANNIVKERIYSCVFPFMIPFINTDDFFKNQNITGLLNDCISACSWGGNTSSLMNLIQFFLSSENLSLNSEFIGQRVLIRQSINTVFKEKYLLFCQKMNRQITKCEEALNLR